MPTKISEGKLLGTIILFICSIVLLINAKVYAAPTRVSEVGLLMLCSAMVLLFFAVRLWKQAVMKG
jgi:hypothetical protein